MTWRFMPTREVIKGQEFWSIREVYKEGSFWSARDYAPMGESLDELRKELTMMLSDSQDGTFLDLCTGTVKKVTTDDQT